MNLSDDLEDQSSATNPTLIERMLLGSVQLASIPLILLAVFLMGMVSVGCFLVRWFVSTNAVAPPPTRRPEQASNQR